MHLLLSLSVGMPGICAHAAWSAEAATAAVPSATLPFLLVVLLLVLLRQVSYPCTVAVMLSGVLQTSQTLSGVWPA